MTERDRESDDVVVIRNLSKVSYIGDHRARVQSNYIEDLCRERVSEYSSSVQTHMCQRK